MRIRTLAPLALLFVGLTVVGCQTADEGSMDDTTTEQPAAEQMNDTDAMDNAEMGKGAAVEGEMADTTAADSARAEMEDEGAMEE